MKQLVSLLLILCSFTIQAQRFIANTSEYDLQILFEKKGDSMLVSGHITNKTEQSLYFPKAPLMNGNTSKDKSFIIISIGPDLMEFTESYFEVAQVRRGQKFDFNRRSFYASKLKEVEIALTLIKFAELNKPRITNRDIQASAGGELIWAEYYFPVTIQ